MRHAITRSFTTHRNLLSNTGALVGTTIATTGMGVAFWWVAARLFTTGALGVASALLSATMWIGTVAVLGLGTLLMGELPRAPERAGALISTSVSAAVVAGGLLGLLFGLLGPLLTPEFALLTQHPATLALFALGGALTAGTLVLDQATIGLLCGGVQLVRNTLFAAAKLALLIVAGLWGARGDGVGIYAAHVAGIILSLLAVTRLPALRDTPARALLPDWRLLRRLGRSALSHHLFNLSLQTPTLLLPILVVTLLSAELNAVFYIAWLIAGFLTLIPVALTNVLYTLGAAQPDSYARQARFTFGLSLLGSAVGAAAIIIAGPFVLGLIGGRYAAQSYDIMVILTLGMLPLVVRQHYVATCRVRGTLRWATWLVVVSAVVQVGLSIAGARVAGLRGLSMGWLVGMLVEAVLMAPLVVRVLLGSRPAAAPAMDAEGAPARFVAARTAPLAPLARLRPGELAVLGRYLLLRARYRQVRGGPFSLGSGCDIHVGPEARVSIGRGVRFSRGCSASLHGEVEIGDGVFFNRGCTLVAYARVAIGANSLFGEYVSIHDENHVVDDSATPIAARGYRAAPVVIGRNVWVGAKATIVAGVTIGDNAVIGTNAVVTRDIPPGAVAVGAPARVIRITGAPAEPSAVGEMRGVSQP